MECAVELFMLEAGTKASIHVVVVVVGMHCMHACMQPRHEMEGAEGRDIINGTRP
jgi:hypothetical protein